MSNSDPLPDGALDGGYADRREASKALKFRYQVRARLAVEAFTARAGGNERPRVLDLGAAEGRTLLEMRRLIGRPGDYHGVEINSALVAAVQGLPRDVQLHAGDVTALPKELEAGTYDLVTLLAVLEHLPRPDQAVAEAFRMLRPGGVVVATCPSPMWDDVAAKLGLIHAGGEHHEHELTIDDVSGLLEQAGFTDIEGKPFMWAPIGSLPYAGISVPVGFSLRADALISRLRVLDFGFVNQAVIAQKP